MSTLPLFGGSRDDEPPAGKKNGGNGERDKVYRVSQLNRAVRGVLEQRWANVWVAGEVSDCIVAASGHAYFTLNDEDEPAQLRVVMFKTDARRSRARLENGARVKVQGQLSLFTPRGSYQMIARMALPDGLGELHAQFERTRLKLEKLGLLAPERKRKLPHLPRVLGVVTSLKGAALHDIIRVAQARTPVRIVIAACIVQGPDAPRSIVRALRRIQQLPELDAVIVGRGGGSAEDLIAFNDERVARAIVESRVPVISAVGHEVDVTIADLVADVRAATPSNAAELAMPDRRALSTELRNADRHLARAAEVWVGRARLRLGRSSQRLRDPRRMLGSTRARLRSSERRMHACARKRLREERARLAHLNARLARLDPRLLLAGRKQRLSQLQARLWSLGRPLCHPHRHELARLAGQLTALSPLASLARGYAIVLHEPSGKALVRASDASPGDALQVRLHEGTLKARVESA
jgi:exodeoxyribonuclease VII large subunit